MRPMRTGNAGQLGHSARQTNEDCSMRSDVHTTLVRYDAMCRAIAAAYEVDEVKDIRDKARAIEMYARQAQNTEAERKACEIRLRAERKCGEMLSSEIDRAPRSRPTKMSDDATLSDLHISRDQSSQWQRLAAIPAEQFEADVTDPMWRPSTAGLIARHDARNSISGYTRITRRRICIGCSRRSATHP
jgi:hypothetical protein